MCNSWPYLGSIFPLSAIIVHMQYGVQQLSHDPLIWFPCVCSSLIDLKGVECSVLSLHTFIPHTLPPSPPHLTNLWQEHTHTHTFYMQCILYMYHCVHYQGHTSSATDQLLNSVRSELDRSITKHLASGTSTHIVPYTTLAVHMQPEVYTHTVASIVHIHSYIMAYSGPLAHLAVQCMCMYRDSYRFCVQNKLLV